jgi:hypothetical protein
MDINQLNEEDIDKYFKAKYIKYKSKYLALKQQKGGVFDIGEAWNTSVQFVQKNVIEKPVNYVTEVTQQLTPQELTPEQKIEDELNQDIAALQQQLIEQKKTVQNTKKGTKEYNDGMKNQMIIDKELSKKIKELQTIKKKQEDFKRQEAEKLRRYIEKEENEKKWKEGQIETKRINNNKVIINELVKIINNNNNYKDKKKMDDNKYTEIYSTYIEIVTHGSLGKGGFQNLGPYALSIYHNSYGSWKFQELLNNIDIKADLFNNKPQRTDLIKKIIDLIFNTGLLTYKISNDPNKSKLINYIGNIIDNYIIVNKNSGIFNSSIR